MKGRLGIIGILAVTLLSGCNSWERYQASVEQSCRERAKGSAARYDACLKKTAAIDRERLRHQDQEWMDSLYDFGRVPVVYVAPRRPY